MKDMFESFKPRAEEIDREKFDALLEDPTFKNLIKDVEERMSFIIVDEDEDNVSFEPEPGYKGALKDARNWLDKKGIRISDRALAQAIAQKLDPEDKFGYVSLV